MAEFTLELIQHINPDYGSPPRITLPIVNHVHKRIERFTYQRAVRSAAIPIAYLENQPVDSRANVVIADKTYLIPVNSSRLTGPRAPVSTVTSNSYTSIYKDIVATNKTFVDEYGQTRPLFWKHILPVGTVQTELQIVEHGNGHLVDTGYSVDLGAGEIYTNYRNYYNPDTGAYRLYFIVSTASNGSTKHELLNPVPVASEAGWQDIDTETGKLTKSYPVYSKERSSSGYTFFFNTASTWHIRPLNRSLLTPKKPIGLSASDPWFMRFSDGDFSANVNGAVHRYYVPEFDKQSFIPNKPIVYSPYERLLWVNNRTLATTRKNLNIAPSQGLHLNLFIYDVNDVLIKVFTTDTSLHGVRYSETNVFYEADQIQSWDNSDGLIVLGSELHLNWDFSATYYYNADDYEYTLVDLNPLSNPSVLDYSFVFYSVPDADTEDRAIHHLVVDTSGFIVFTSQDLGLSHPNLQLHNSDGSYNSGTVIGMRYNSEIFEDTFVRKYSAGFSNQYAYNILCEVSVCDIALVENMFEVDVRRPGGVIVPEKFAEVISANPRILQSRLGYGEDGQEVPQNAVMILKAPLTMLKDYGGALERNSAARLLKTYMPSAAHAVIEFEGPRSLLTGYSIETAVVYLEATWEGPELDYRLYRRSNPTGEWILVQTQSWPVEGAVVYTDTDVASGDTWYYEVRIFDGSYEYPSNNSLGIKVK
jgi:hypothetical protein